ncbi:hypothetical protein HY844_01530 [Candidatus Berkelbacteria bacterium]|nr:hypothetical protein [Candidatus Berkelbacteria bacterium]
MKNLFKKLRQVKFNKQTLYVVLAGLGLLVVVTYGAFKFQQLVSPEDSELVNGIIYGLKVSDRQSSGNPLPNSMTNTAVPLYNFDPTINGPTKLNVVSGGFNMARIQGGITYYER